MKSLAKMQISEEVQDGQEEGDGIQEIVAVEETKKPAQVMQEAKEKTSVMDQGQPDRHPEKRRKAAYR